MPQRRREFKRVHPRYQPRKSTLRGDLIIGGGLLTSGFGAVKTGFLYQDAIKDLKRRYVRDIRAAAAQFRGSSAKNISFRRGGSNILKATRAKARAGGYRSLRQQGLNMRWIFPGNIGRIKPKVAKATYARFSKSRLKVLKKFGKKAIIPLALTFGGGAAAQYIIAKRSRNRQANRRFRDDARRAAHLWVGGIPGAALTAATDYERYNNLNARALAKVVRRNEIYKKHEGRFGRKYQTGTGFWSGGGSRAKKWYDDDEGQEVFRARQYGRRYY